MAKDPRFNFYPDNWIGGTEGFTLEQEGAYLALIIMQSKVGRFTKEQAIDKLLQKTRGNAAASAGLWKFLMQKFDTDGEFFWSARLESEMDKSKKHSKNQSERAKTRWNKNSGNAAAYTPEMPDNGSGIGIIGIEEKIKSSFDEIYLDTQRLHWKHIDFQFEYDAFCNKIRGSPGAYSNHTIDGLRLALQSQLRTSKRKPPKQKTGLVV